MQLQIALHLTLNNVKHVYDDVTVWDFFDGQLAKNPPVWLNENKSAKKLDEIGPKQFDRLVARDGY